MAGLGQPVLDPVLGADPVEDVGAEVSPGRPVPVPGQIGEGHAVVGQHGVDGVGERRHHAAEQVGSVHLPCVVAELGVGELRHAIDGEDHGQLALGQAQLAVADVEGADCGLGELASPRGLVRVVGQAGDAVALEAAVQAGACQLRDGVAQAAEHVVERQQGAAAELDHHGLLGWRQDCAARRRRTHGQVIGRGPGAPLGDGGAAQAIALGQGAGRLLRRLEPGSNSRRRSGAAAKTACHSASSP